MASDKSGKNIEAGDTSRRILVVDDEKDIGEFIADVAEMMNFSCTTTSNAADFMAVLNPKVTLIIMDLMMPDMDGIEILRLLKARDCKSKIVLISGVDKRVLETAEELAESLGLSVVGHLQKPFRQVDLEKILTASRIVDPSGGAEAAQPISKQSAITITVDELEHALLHNEFVIYYQPQVELATGVMVGVESLVRWQHPKQGLLVPDVFIPITESLGMIDQLFWIVAKKALSEIGQIAKKNGITVTVSLNVSPYSLHNLKFPDTLLKLAEECGVQPSNIIVEITESGLFKELSKALDILTRLRMKQVKLSIDDFGTGFAMMQQLRNVPATELKIDKSFIQDMLVQDSARVMVLKIMEMAHELGIKVVAEGVENTNQLEFLRANHCDLIQGYFFSRPLPLPALLDWFKNFHGS